MSKTLMTIEDLSNHLGIPINTLYKWRTKNYGPTGRRIGKYIRYRPEDVDTWIEDQGGA
ncbi:helix-turn-helix protein [Amycolatopsis sulphurea]|uniref:AlpA family transcriptional regulator n=1 Tax=Amycolatopsis sulphurea TaxID=76022 RepID=A0A2A9FKK0_9PSEU|nr:helix-turn-helix domain-containing protein [Amycolatopsis sulphurea]PFG51082.1 AlpA family transcriptional regulator [Amycolatopsis sulphurea]PFG57646.1 helix-turn-helix protein [Amycolatopsis sulphurea]